MRFSLALSTILYLSVLAGSATSWQPAQQPRFDMQVREDMFAGFNGDRERFARAMKLCEDSLAANPDHAEALVWHGSGLIVQAGAAYQSGDFQRGGALWSKGLAEMDKAVGLAPNSLGTRIPRGASLFEASRRWPNRQEADALVRTAIEDYERSLQMQQNYFSTISDHAKGELLFALADGWARLGDKEKAAGYFKRLMNDAGRSGRASYAKAWLDGAPPSNPGRCVGCH